MSVDGFNRSFILSKASLNGIITSLVWNGSALEICLVNIIPKKYSALKTFCQPFHGNDAKQLSYDFCQKIVGCEIYCSFA